MLTAYLLLLAALLLHELAHLGTAVALGDRCGLALGRANPFRSIDPLGTVLVPLALLALGAPAVGWAIPMPVNPSQIRAPTFRNLAWVAAAGPLCNLALALGALVLHGPAPWVRVNLALFTVNLLPVRPLDGWLVVSCGWAHRRALHRESALDRAAHAHVHRAAMRAKGTYPCHPRCPGCSAGCPKATAAPAALARLAADVARELTAARDGRPFMVYVDASTFERAATSPSALRAAVQCHLVPLVVTMGPVGGTGGWGYSVDVVRP